MVYKYPTPILLVILRMSKEALIVTRVAQRFGAIDRGDCLVTQNQIIKVSHVERALDALNELKAKTDTDIMERVLYLYGHAPWKHYERVYVLAQSVGVTTLIDEDIGKWVTECKGHRNSHRDSDVVDTVCCFLSDLVSDPISQGAVPDGSYTTSTKLYALYQAWATTQEEPKSVPTTSAFGRILKTVLMKPLVSTRQLTHGNPRKAFVFDYAEIRRNLRCRQK